MAEVVPPYKDEELLGESVSKKDVVTFLQENASSQFLLDHKLVGAVKNVVKTKTKEQLADAYKELFRIKAFKTEGDQPIAPGRQPQAAAKQSSKTADVEHVTHKTKKLDVKVPEAIKYTKNIIKAGNRSTFPSKGDTVACYYTGRLDSGKVFDTNIEEGKKAKKAEPLRFKVGVGKVIRGWDEALLTMSVGERAEIVIQPEWAYGKKGVEGKVPPNSVLTFEVELVETSS